MSTPIADDLGRIEIRALRGFGKRASHAFFEPVKVVARMLARELPVFRIQQDALRAGGIVDDFAAELRAVRRRTTRARTELVP